MHFYDLFAPDVREELKCAALGAFSQGQPFRGFQNPNVRRDGPSAFLETSGTPTLDTGGNVVGYRGADTDITARKRVEERIAPLAVAVEQAADDIMVTDAGGIITYVNAAFERTTGYSRLEAVGRSPTFLENGECDKAFYGLIDTTIASGQNWYGRFSNRTKDGRAILQDASISPILDASGRIIGQVSARRDVTRQVEIEAHLAQAETLEAIGTLASATRSWP
jgi:PAS domain S-box-containing protein